MAVTKKKFVLVLENLGSLITFKGTDDKNHCLGYLWAAKGHGVFDATYGKVDVTPEQSEIHNKLYDEANIKGLDEQCQVGQGSVFYVSEPKPRSGKWFEVRTFLGTVVAAEAERLALRKKGRNIVVTFERKGRKFKGTWSRSKGDMVFFERIA